MPIAAAAHITHGQGCAVELRNGHWFPGNLIRTSNLPAIEADDRADANPHIERLGREIRTVIDGKNIGRTQKKTRALDRDELAVSFDEFKLRAGAKPFVVDDQRSLQAADLSVLCQIGMPVVPISASKDQDELLQLVTDIKNDLASMMANAGSQPLHNETESANTMSNTLNFYATVRDVSTGKHATHINNEQTQGLSLEEVVNALNSLQALLAQDNPHKALVDEAIATACDGKPLVGEKKEKIARLLTVLKKGADSAESLGKIVDNAEKAGKKLGQIAATASAAITQYWPQLTVIAAPFNGGV